MCWCRGLLSPNSQSSLQRASQTLWCGALFRSTWQPTSLPPYYLSNSFILHILLLGGSATLWSLDSLWIKLRGAFAKMCAPGRTLRDFLCLSVVGKVKWTEIKNCLISPWIVGVWFDYQVKVKPCRNSAANCLTSLMNCFNYSANKDL